MNKWILLFAFPFFLQGCIGNNSENPVAKYISETKAKNDLDIYISILKKAHPSLDVYITKERFSFIADSIRSSITDEQTLADLFNKITFINNEIGCSHSTVFMPDYVYDTIQNRPYFFPYPVKFIGDKLLVNATGCDLFEGTEIRYINGEPVKKVLKNLMFYNPVEGVHRKTQQNLGAEDLALQYFFYYGPQKKFYLKFTDTLGIEKESVEEPVTFSEWNTRYSSLYYFDRTDADYDLSITPEKHYAYLRLATFDFKQRQKQEAYEDFCQNSFELLQQKKDITALIIDLRENTGGKLYNAFLLYSFLANSPFKEYDKVLSKISSIPYTKYLDPAFAPSNKDDTNERLENDFLAKDNKGFYEIPDSLIDNWKPNKFHFSGAVYIITNSTVVSSASYFALLVKNSGRGKIVGDETDGGSYSGNGFSTLKYVLPNSGMQITFPYAHIIYSDKDEKNTGRGVIPNYNVPDTYASFKNNTDRQIDFILDSLILKNK